MYYNTFVHMGSKRKRSRKKYINKQNINLNNKPKNEVNVNHISLLKLIKSNLILLLVFGVIIVISYAGLIGSEFITADDTTSIVNNPLVSDLNASLAKLELTPIYNAVFFNLFNKSTLGFRLFSMFMHTINTFLVFILVRRLYSEKQALMVSFLFSVHPAISEAVNWISANGYLFIGFFTFITIILFVEYRLTKNSKFLISAAAIYIFSLFFFKSPWLLIIPLILIVLDFTHFINKDGEKLKIPFMSLLKSYFPILGGGIIYGSYVYYQQYTTRLHNFGDLYFDPQKADPLIKRLPYSVYKALEILSFPNKLSIFHEGEIIKPFYYNSMVAVTIMVALLIIYLFFMKKYRSFGLIVIIYLSILPVFSPVVVAWFIAERYLYVGSFAFLILFTSILLKIEKKTFEKFAMMVVIIVFIIFGVRTVIRTHDFKTNKGIWLATLKNAPLSYRVFNNLGDVYTKEGSYEEAIKYFEQSVKLKPDYADAVYNIGYVYTLLPDFEKAQAFLMKSIEMNPRIFQSYYVLGIISYKQGDIDTAIKLMQKTLEINPQYDLANRAIQELISLKQKGVVVPGGSVPGGSVPEGAIIPGTQGEQLISDQTQPPQQPQIQPGIQEQQPVQPPAPQQQVPVLPILQGATVPIN
jgi:hypothetical protein